MNRREWLQRTGAVVGAAVATTGADAHAADQAGQAGAQGAAPPKPDASLKLVDYQPKSMLHVPVTKVEKAAFPVIDMHTHLSMRNNSARAKERAMPASELLKVMDARNIRTMINLTGGQGERLAAAVAGLDRAHPGRFLTFTEPTWAEAQRPDYAKWQADELAKAKAAGAMGVKVLKTLGLFLRDKDASGKDGALVKVDDPRFGPMWEQAGALGLPIGIHVGDPEAFFLPTDRYNERYEELANHPDWSFHGKDFPSFKAILEARDRVFARHPKTTFVALHVGHWAENLPRRRRDARQVPQRAHRDRRAHRRARAPAPAVAEVLRQVPGPDHVRHRRRAQRHRDAAADFRRRAVPDLLPVPARPRTSTSTTRRRPCRRRAAGRSTASGCPSPS